jgi:hypothetical protein
MTELVCDCGRRDILVPADGVLRVFHIDDE